jgi:hypothetical protein
LPSLDNLIIDLPSIIVEIPRRFAALVTTCPAAKVGSAMPIACLSWHSRLHKLTRLETFENEHNGEWARLVLLSLIEKEKKLKNHLLSVESMLQSRSKTNESKMQQAM